LLTILYFHPVLIVRSLPYLESDDFKAFKNEKGRLREIYHGFMKVRGINPGTLVYQTEECQYDA
jgi:hypothetical protein